MKRVFLGITVHPAHARRDSSCPHMSRSMRGAPSRPEPTISWCSGRSGAAHCEFLPGELTTAFDVLVNWVVNGVSRRATTSSIQPRLGRRLRMQVHAGGSTTPPSRPVHRRRHRRGRALECRARPRPVLCRAPALRDERLLPALVREHAVIRRPHPADARAAPAPRPAEHDEPRAESVSDIPSGATWLGVGRRRSGEVAERTLVGLAVGRKGVDEVGQDLERYRARMARSSLR